MDTTKTIINEYLLKMLEAVEKGVEIASNEIPLILTEYVTYKAVYYWVITAVLSLGYIVVGKMIKTGTKLNKEDYSEGYAWIFVGIMGGIVLSFVFFNFFFNAIQATFFPRVFLLDQAMGLVNGCSNCH